MVTPGCCCWYLANAALKNGASKVEPDPDRVGLVPPGPMLATADAEAPVAPAVLVLVVLVQAATAREVTAAAVTQRAGWVVWRGWEPGRVCCPDMGAPLYWGRS